MEIYQTEEQQVEAIKGYWQKNGTTIIAGIVIGLVGFIGFNKYTDNVLAQEEAVSDSYQALFTQSELSPESFTANGEKFVAENSESNYASLALFALANEAAASKDWAGAKTQLTNAIDAAPTAGIKAIGSLRLARVQVQLSEYEDAIATLNNLPVSFAAAAEEIKGDAYILQGKEDLARNAYQAAIAANGLSTSPGLQVKFDDLAEANVLPTASIVTKAVSSEEK